MSDRPSLKDLMLQYGAIQKQPTIAASYINGEWVNGEGAYRIDVNPATNIWLGALNDCLDKQIDLAFAASRRSQKHWAKENQRFVPEFDFGEVGLLEKRKILDMFARILDEYRGELTLLIAQEMGKTAFTADADIEESIHAAEHYRDIILLSMKGEYRDAQLSDKKSLTKRFPYGTVLAIKPFNFIALYWWTVCAAITAGNSVVIKASEDIPFTVNATVVMFHEAMKRVLGDNFKKVESLVQVLQGAGETVGEYAAVNGDYDMLSFTGGTETKSKLQVVCAQRNKHFHAESGGHAAIIVLDDFDLEKAANEIVLAAFGDAGQRCTSTKVVLAQDTIYDKLLSNIVERARKLRIGDPANLETKIGPIINTAALDRVISLIDQTSRQLERPPYLGGIALNSHRITNTGFNIGRELKSPYYNARRLNFITPTIFTDVPYGVTAMDKEIFGPVLVFNKVIGENRLEVLKKAVDLVNQSKYGLSSALLTNDVRLLFWAFDHTHTGVWYGGRGTTGAEVPGYFSVVKESGNGYEAYGIEEYSWVKQGWLDLYPETRLAQTSAVSKVEKNIEKAKSVFKY